MRNLVRAVLTILGLVAVAAGAVLLWKTRGDREPASPRYAVFETDVMATRLRVTVLVEPETGGLDEVGEDAAEGAGRRASEAAHAVFGIFREVDARMSEWKETSPLSAVNRAAGGEPVPVPADLRRVLHRALDVARRTDGAFDPTWAALWGLWDFRAAEPRVPAAEEIARRAALVDWTRVEIHDSAGTVRLSEPGMMLGLGGIAKGWALDRAAEELRRRGFNSFLLTAGGQVMAGGLRHTVEGRRPWEVGIRDPRGGPDDFFARVPVTDASLSTSGDYESFFVVDGVRYHHILDPRTGRPARGLRSATVISPDATLADALSTALVVMGAERGMRTVAGMPEVEAVLVDGAGEVTVSPGLEGRLDLRHAPRP